MKRPTKELADTAAAYRKGSAAVKKAGGSKAVRKLLDKKSGKKPNKAQ